MKHLARLFLVLASVVTGSCGDETPEQPAATSRLQVYVYWGDTGLAERRLEILELDLETLTDEAGLAEFEIPEGTYTLRVHDITLPGPQPPYVDRTVATKQGETTRVEVADCLPCVTPVG